MWDRRGIPRRRNKLGAAIFATPMLRTIATPIERVAHYGALGWHVYVGKSLGHPKFVTDPYPLYRKLRETEPMRKDPIAPMRVITRYSKLQLATKKLRWRKGLTFWGVHELPLKIC